MKFSITSFVVAALAAVVAARPAFTNTEFNVIANQPFELRWIDNTGPVTIVLNRGPNGQSLVPAETLASNVAGTSTSVTLKSSLPSGTYAFSIFDASSVNDPNYSIIFTFVGSAASSSSSSSVGSTSSTVSRTSSATSVSTTTSASTSTTSTANTTTTGTTTTSGSTTRTGTTTSTSSTGTSQPNNTNAGGRLKSPLAMVFLGAAAYVFLN